MAVDQQARAYRAWTVLTDCALNRETITYGDLAERIGLSHHRPIRFVLGEVQDFCMAAENDLPPLTSVVVGKSSGAPGQGFIAGAADDPTDDQQDVFNFDWREIPNPFPPSDEKPKRNPAWVEDELILALDLYARRGGGIDPSDDEVVALSKLLNRLPVHEGARQQNYRNANSVALKLANFRRLDPGYEGKGMASGAKLDEVIWNRYAHRPKELAKVAARLRDAVESGAAAFAEPVPEEDEPCAEEGRVLYRLHRARERDRRIIERKKAAVEKATGILACEVCAFDFNDRWGELGAGYIECHHLRHLAETGPKQTRLEDLALVCSNCHRMFHRLPSGTSVAELRSRLAGASAPV